MTSPTIPVAGSDPQSFSLLQPQEAGVPTEQADEPASQFQSFAHHLLGEFCACYGEAWPAKTCDAEAARLSEWLGASSSTVVADLLEMYKLAVAVVQSQWQGFDDQFATRGRLGDEAFKLAETLITAAVEIEHLRAGVSK